jgi:hypothetical protein
VCHAAHNGAPEGRLDRLSQGITLGFVPFLVAAARAGEHGLTVTADPQPGDIVCYDLDGSNFATGKNHIGMFEKRTGPSTFQTIEGNVDDECKRMKPQHEYRAEDRLRSRRPVAEAGPGPHALGVESISRITDASVGMVRTRVLSASVVGAVLLLSGCGGTTANSGVREHSSTSSAPSVTRRTSTTLARRRHHKRVAHRRHRRRHHVAIVRVAAGVPAVDLPNPSLTPGAVLTTSTARICESGYASSVRDVPESEKDEVYARYGVAHVPDQYEVDHLVSLEVGGSNAISNLWPEPYAGRWGARTKDVLEDKLHDLVCSEAIGLRYAQRIEARNWVAAYKRYVGTPPLARGSGPGGSSGLGSGTTGSGGTNCTPGYSPCLPYKGGEDYDCYGGGGNGPLFTSPGVTYTVTGTDPYDLDGDGDGKACGS